MLTMTGLTKTYRTESVETTALDSIDLDIADGAFVESGRPLTLQRDPGHETK